MNNRIGLFLGFQGRIELDGEGIGRFAVRLVEGFMNIGNVTIYVVTNEQNYDIVQNLFRSTMPLYPDRIFIVSFPANDVSWINVHVPVSTWIVPYVGLVLAIQLEKPIILCVHDLVYVDFRKEFIHYGLYIPEPTVQLLSHKASAIVSQSNYVSTNHVMRYLGIPKEKAHVVRLAAPEKEYITFGNLTSTVFRDKYGLIEEYMVFPSSIRPYKNHLRLIEAFLRFKQTNEGNQSKLRLVVTDHPRGLLQTQILQLINQFNPELRDSIVFLGRIPSEDIPALYANARGTVVPTLFEGSCPFPILESLLMGTPVAVSRIAVTEELISDMNAFLAFDPYSIEEIQGAIHYLWKESHALLEKQKQLMAHVLERTWANVATEYSELITS